VQALEHAKWGGFPCGLILDVVARQPDLLSRAGKGAQKGNKPGVGRYDTADGVVSDSETSLIMRLMQTHVDPGPVLLVQVLYESRVPFCNKALVIL
jgi:hypothetical protein